MAWRSKFWRGLAGADETATNLHEYVVRHESEFVGGEMTGRRISEGIWKIVGRLKTGGIYVHAYAFSAERYSAVEARRWLAKHASALFPKAKHKALKFEMNYETKEHKDKDGNVETIDLLGVAVATAGEWKGKFWGPEELAEMVRADEAAHKLVQPVFKIEHVEAGPAYGWLGPLRMEGETIYADIMSIPKTLFDEIKQGRYSRLSPEILNDWTEPSTQETFKHVLSAVVVLGVQMPAMTSLPGLSEFKALEGEKIYLGDEEDLALTGTIYELVSFAVDDKANKADEEDESMADEKALKEREDAIAAQETAMKDKFAAAQKELDDRSEKLHKTRVEEGMKTVMAKIEPKEIEEVEQFAMDLPDEKLDAYFAQMSKRADVEHKPTGGKGQPTGDPEKDLDVEDRIIMEAKKLAREDKITFTEALPIAEEALGEEKMKEYNKRNFVRTAEGGE